MSGKNDAIKKRNDDKNIKVYHYFKCRIKEFYPEQNIKIPVFFVSKSKQNNKIEEIKNVFSKKRQSLINGGKQRQHRIKQ